MRDCDDLIESPAPLRIVARAIGVTETWLRAECEAGRIPCLRVGPRSYLLDLPTVRRELLARTRGEAPDLTAPDGPPPAGGSDDESAP